MTPDALQSTACVVKLLVTLAPTIWPALLIATAAALPSGSAPGRMESGVVDDPAATKPRLPTIALVCAVPTMTPASLMSLPHIVSQQPVRTCAPVEADQRNALMSGCDTLRFPDPVT